MPTISVQIDEALAGNDLSARLSNQISKLTSVGTTAENFFKNPPADISQLINSLGKLPLPDTNKLGALPQTISNLQTVVPADLSGVTGKLAAGIAALSEQADGAIVRTVTNLVNSLNALHGVMQLLTKEAGAGEVVPVPFARMPAGPILGATATSGEIAHIIQALNRLPDPLNVDSLLDGLNVLLNGFKRGLFPMAHLPFVDELAQTLNTLFQWRGMTGVQIAGHLENTLHATGAFVGGRLDGDIDPIAGLATTLNSNLHPGTLQDLLQNLHDELQTLASAVTNTDLPAIDSTLITLGALRTQLETALSGLTDTFFSGQSTELLQRLNSFRDSADASMCSLLTHLNPATDIGLLASLSAQINAAFNPDEIERTLDGYRELSTWLRGVIDQIDLSSIEEPVASTAGALQGAVDDLDKLLVDVVTEVSLLFDDVQAAIDQVDTAAVAAEIKGAVQKFQQQVQGEIDKLFNPIKDALTAGINAINSAAGEFDPEDIIDALQGAMQTLTGVLSNPQLLAALENIRGKLDGMTAQLGTISFKPANDVIVSQLDEVRGILETMDTSLLNNAIKLALTAAVELLPDEDDLKGVKNEILAELDQLVTSGPATLMLSIQAQPEQLLAKIGDYSPLVLVGDSLSVPFQTLVKELQGFQPSELLEPVQSALDQVKKTLEQKANPGQFIAPLEAPFAELTGLLDQLQPQKLVEPLNQAIQEALNAIIEALPVEELFAVFDAILAQLQKVVDTIGALRELFHRGMKLLEGFDNPEAQMTNWINGIIDRLDQVPDTTNLTLAFEAAAAGVARLRSNAILERVLAPLQPLSQSLANLQPQAALTQLIRDCRDFPHDAVAALPQPQRQNVEEFFGLFDPKQPDISRPLNNLQHLSDDLQPISETITNAFVGWDAYYHGPGSYLSTLIPADTSMPAVKTLLKATVQAEIGEPLAVIFKVLPNLGQVVNGFVTVFDEFAAHIEEKMSVLVGGPASLTSIRESMGQLVDTIQHLNLNFLTSELEGVFTNVKGKFNAISPAALRGIVEDAFAEALANLDLAKLLPMSEITALDAQFAAIVSVIGQLDPNKLVVEVLQPEFEAAIKPLMEPFDLTATITGVIEQLDRLKADLSVELDRTIAAFLAMVDAVPSLELSLDVDIEVDIGF